jgi:LacI family transcriptional regulator
MQTSKPVTLKQIAAAVNKTAVTVSKALRNHPDISHDTKAEIQAVAQKLGYTPNLIARKLSSREKRTIGLVVPRVAHPFFSEAIDAIYDEAHQRGYDIFMMVSGEDTELEAHHIRTLLALQVDGFLISISEKTGDMPALATVLNNRKHVVFFDRILENTGCSSVTCDNYQGCYDLVSFALSNGYTELGHLAGYSKIHIGKERRRGCEQAAKDHGIAIKPEWIVEGGFDQSDGYKGLMTMQRSGSLPQIICTAGFSIALGALKAIRELGLSVPEDVELISFGDSVYNEHIKPSITAIRLDARQMGKMAVDLLINQFNDSVQGEQNIVVPTRLVVHDTGLGSGRHTRS